MKTRNKLMWLLAVSAMVVILPSCEKDEDDPPVEPPVNEEELITTLILRLADQTSNDTAVFTFTDLDGDGGNAPVVVGDTIAASAMFNGHIEVLNEVDGEDITQEIAEISGGKAALE